LIGVGKLDSRPLTAMINGLEEPISLFLNMTSAWLRRPGFIIVTWSFHGADKRGNIVLSNTTLYCGGVSLTVISIKLSLGLYTTNINIDINHARGSWS
jgi:hypothetical protein